MSFHCGVCGCVLTADVAVSCEKCQMPFHRDCFEYAGRCGRYACGSKRHVPYQELAASAVVEIDERTRPAFRIEPLVEALVRKLPRGGRRLGAPVFLGVASGFLVVLVECCLWKPTHLFDLLLRPVGWGLIAGLAAGVLGTTMHRRPLTVAGVTLAVWAATVAALINHRPGFLPPVHIIVLDLLGEAIAGGLPIIVCSALVEFILAHSRRVTRTDLLSGGLLRSLFTCGLLFLFSCAFFVVTGIAGNEPIARAAVYSLFGLFVAGPSVELSKSALMHRLTVERER